MNDALRVVYVAACAELGGAERLLLDAAESVRLHRPRSRPCVLCPGDGPLADEARARGLEVVLAPLPPALARLGDTGTGAWPLAVSLARASGAVVRHASGMRRLLAGLQPDVVHTHGTKMHLLAASAAAPGVPLVWHLHEYVGRGLAARLLRARARRARVVVANSSSVAEEARRALGVPVHVVHNAIDLDAFRPGGPALDLDALCGLAPPDGHVVRVGLVGTFGRWKGHEVFLRALARLPASLPVRGYVVGAPIYATAGSQWSLADLHALVDTLGLRGRVGFTGFVPHPADAVRALDVLVHASTTPEPFGLVVAEGMAAARAVVVSAAGGALELFEEGVDAVGFPPGDVDALAACLVRLARDPALRQRLGERAAASARAKFDRRRLASELVPLYEQALAARGAA